MPATLLVRDETTAGHRTGETVVEFLSEQITVRELIRGRVYQEVEDYNRRRPDTFRGLVDPNGSECVLNGVKLRQPRTIDWKQQFDRACDAFQRNGFFVLIDDRQAESLDEMVTLRPGTSATFVKLTPLVGG